MRNVSQTMIHYNTIACLAYHNKVQRNVCFFKWHCLLISVVKINRTPQGLVLYHKTTTNSYCKILQTYM